MANLLRPVLRPELYVVLFLALWWVLLEEGCQQSAAESWGKNRLIQRSSKRRDFSIVPMWLLASD
jgi:hypothetical protein